jgi:hypothetical protein
MQMPNFTTRVNFNNTNRGANGGHRVGGLTADAAGDLDGMTALGGANGDGTAFDIPSIDGNDAGTPTSFDAANGAYPDAGPIAAAGDLSGTTISTFTNFRPPDIRWRKDVRFWRRARADRFGSARIAQKRSPFHGVCAAATKLRTGIGPHLRIRKH